MPLRLPALVAVNEFSEKGGLLGVACDEFVLQELLGSGSLPGRQSQSRVPPSQQTGRTEGCEGWALSHPHVTPSLHKLLQALSCQGQGRVGVGNRPYESWVLIEAGLYKLLEGFAVVALQRGWVILRNQEQDSHRV